MSFESACRTLEVALRGEARREILAEASKAKTFNQSLARLREVMRGNRFPGGTVVRELDDRTRRDGFDVLHDWDGKADHPNEEIIPVDVLNFAGTLRIANAERALAILLDYYFFYVLSLLALRAWDEGDANRNLDRVSALADDLQGANGSGHRFAGNAAALIFVATSHFEPDGNAYIRLLERVRSLDDAHQQDFALLEAAILSSHLRFGFDPFYKKDIGEMRGDNAPDYPWLCYSVLALMRAYARGERPPEVVEALLNGLAPDTRAFMGKPPVNLSAHEHWHAEFRELFEKHREELLKDFDRHKPSVDRYSPIAFSFNFPHNLIKAAVVDAAIRGEGWKVTLNDLLRGGNPDSEKLARTLMAYAVASPEKLRGREFPIIVYDPYAGIRTFTRTLSLIKTA